MLLKWVLAVLAVVGGFTASGIAGSIATDALGFWSLPGAGCCAAFTVVVVAYISAPDSKFFAACTALVLGAIAAWLIVEPSWYPESYGERGAYQPTHLPLITTYIGGIAGLIVVAVHNFGRKPNNSLKSDSAKPSVLG